mmetsp:Transcript_28975/g.72492  ORF Transcript_28975/g.72492 Transcript_28975/m.72492 type:complete len:278 (+) Transcript_28975:215-1048(+)
MIASNTSPINLALAALCDADGRMIIGAVARSFASSSVASSVTRVAVLPSIFVVLAPSAPPATALAPVPAPAIAGPPVIPKDVCKHTVGTSTSLVKSWNHAASCISPPEAPAAPASALAAASSCATSAGTASRSLSWTAALVSAWRPTGWGGSCEGRGGGSTLTCAVARSNHACTSSSLSRFAAATSSSTTDEIPPLCLFTTAVEPTGSPSPSPVVAAPSPGRIPARRFNVSPRRGSPYSCPPPGANEDTTTRQLSSSLRKATILLGMKFPPSSMSSS